MPISQGLLVETDWILLGHVGGAHSSGSIYKDPEVGHRGPCSGGGLSGEMWPGQSSGRICCVAGLGHSPLQNRALSMSQM